MQFKDINLFIHNLKNSKEYNKMKTIKTNYGYYIPNNFTGIAEYPNGYKEWYKEGKLHRENGPAVIHPDGTKFWYKDGRLHRENGPAVELLNGTNYWYIEDNPYSLKVLSKLINSSFFLGKEKGRYSLEWFKFLTKEGIKEFPIIPKMKKYKIFKEIFNKLNKIGNK
jgi:hypothetical protein